MYTGREKEKVVLGEFVNSGIDGAFIFKINI